MKTRMYVFVIAAIMLLVSCSQSVVGEWTATYCSVEGCPTGGTETARSGVIYEGNEFECPLIWQELKGYTSVGKFRVPNYETWYLKEDSCAVD